MFFKTVILTAALVGSAAALAIEERAIDPALAPLGNVPPACQSSCEILTGLANIDPSNLSTLSAVCTPETGASFNTCITCFERESPATFTPELLTALQSAADQLGTGCLLVGSPVSSITIPTPTGTGGGSANTGAATLTGTASSAVVSPSATTSRNSAMNLQAGGAGLVAVISAIGAALVL
ncbi:hypothetical protein M408DRAFT_332577 [Serendipita vermifera MAFF 305830]|uniref:Fungal calcium binding protein domain-containing protein n=1 Tax=Serendipita vermifera MAFF 305830 TaxID=933852 RepID=A0A0C3ASJ4_SERVB|nr:hypothetical protein M408DRAFT_332577 [Serendipita vermifera MAFF 305830]